VYSEDTRIELTRVFHDPFRTEQKKGNEKKETLPFGVRKIRRFSQKFQNCLVAPMPFAKLIEEDEPTFTLLVSMTPKETAFQGLASVNLSANA